MDRPALAAHLVSAHFVRSWPAACYRQQRAPCCQSAAVGCSASMKTSPPLRLLKVSGDSARPAPPAIPHLSSTYSGHIRFFEFRIIPL